MKKFLGILFLVFSPFTLSAQESDLEALSIQKTKLEQQILTLQDSLQDISARIDTLKARQESAKPHLKLLPNEFLTSDKVVIRISPDITSTELLEVDKHTAVIKIDHIDGFYLVCFQGTCGYVPEKGLLPKNAENKRDEIGM